MQGHIIQDGTYTIYGMFCSYFTKKLETYFLIKGIPYEFVEVDSPAFAQIARKVGVTQIPLVECPDGTWLCDTTPIIQEFEADPRFVALHPEDPFAAFCAYFLEDSFDEWLWAPALYYRWAFDMDRVRRSEEFTYTVAANGLKLPRFVLRSIITWRQKNVHLQENGITSPAHARVMEDLYIDLLDLLQPVLKKRPYLLGDRPCEADIGLQGPMFPHFANDPTSQEIMQARAPHVFRWVARLWSTRPEELDDVPAIKDVPVDLKPLMQKLGQEYVPYLAANLAAFQAGDASTRYTLQGLEWEVATAPYRVYCLAQLQQRFHALCEAERVRAREYLGDAAVDILARGIVLPPEMAQVTAASPARTDEDLVARLWQKKSRFERFMDARRVDQPSRAAAEAKGEGSNWLPIYFKHHRAR